MTQSSAKRQWLRLTPLKLALLLIGALIVLTMYRSVWLPPLVGVGSEMSRASRDYNKAHTDMQNAARHNAMAVAPTAKAHSPVVVDLKLPEVETDEQRAERKLQQTQAERGHVRVVP